MKHSKNYSILLGILTICFVFSGIFIPGKLLSFQEKQEYNKVYSVQKQYLSSSAAMSRNASQNLSNNERLQLITGQWESEIQAAKNYEMSQQDYEIVAIAKEQLKQLYDNGLYPVDLSSGYGNWYIWKTEAFKAVDTTFHTYTAYYWKIEFQKYDQSQTHTIWILEDGTIFLAETSGIEKMETPVLNTAENVLEMYRNNSPEENTVVLALDFSDKKIEDWFPYGNLPASDMIWQGLTRITKGTETYAILQCYNDKNYCYWMIPYTEGYQN